MLAVAWRVFVWFGRIRFWGPRLGLKYTMGGGTGGEPAVWTKYLNNGIVLNIHKAFEQWYCAG